MPIIIVEPAINASLTEQYQYFLAATGSSMTFEEWLDAGKASVE